MPRRAPAWPPAQQAVHLQAARALGAGSTLMRAARQARVLAAVCKAGALLWRVFQLSCTTRVGPSSNRQAALATLA